MAAPDGPQTTERPAGVPSSAFGPRPTIGPAAAAKQVAQDASALVRAEIELAKAEVLGSVEAKAVGAGLLAAAGAVIAVALLGLLLTIGFVLAEVAGMPGWGAALTVSVALLVVAGILIGVGRSRLSTEVSTDTTRRNLEADVAHTKERLGR